MAYSDIVLADGPVGYWRFDEETGTVVNDSSGNAFHGTRSGTAEDGALLIDGRSLTLGSATIPRTDALAMAGSPGLTVEAWFKFNTPLGEHPVTYPILGIKRNTTEGGWAVHFANTTLDRVTWQVPNGSSYLSLSVTSPDGEWVVGKWYHFVGIKDGTALRGYVNGQLRASSNNAAATVLDSPSDVRWGGSFIGTVDEGAVYNRALTADEIWEHYEVGSGAHRPSTYGAAVLGESVYGDSIQAFHVSAPATVLDPSTTTTYTFVANHLSAPPSVLTPVSAPGPVTAVANLATAPATLHAPTATTQTTVVTNLLAAPATVSTPTNMAPGPVTAVAQAVGTTPVVQTPGGEATYTVGASLLSAPAALITPADVLPGPVSAAAPLLSDPPAVHTPENVFERMTMVWPPTDVTVTDPTLVADANLIAAPSSVHTPTPSTQTDLVALLLAAPAALADPATLPGPVSIVTNLLTAPATTLSPATAPGPVSVEADLLAAPATVLSPAALPGGVVFSADLLSAPSLIHAPADLLRGPVTATTPLVGAPEAVAAPGVLAESESGASHFTDAPAVYTPTAWQAVIPPLLTAHSTLHPPEAVAVVEAPLLAAPAAPGQPSTAVGPVTAVLPVIAAPASLAQPSTAVGGVTVATAALSAAATVLEPEATTTYSGATPLVTDSPAVHTPSTNHDVVVPLLAAPATANDPTSLAVVYIGAPFVQAPTAFADPAADVGPVLVVPDLLAAPATAIGPAALPGGVGVGAPLVQVTTALHPASAAPGAVAFEPTALSAPATVHGSDVLPGGVAVETAALATTTTVHGATVAPGGVTAIAEVITAGSTVLTPSALATFTTAAPNLLAPETVHAHDAVAVVSADLLVAPAALHEAGAAAQNDVSVGHLSAPAALLDPGAAPGEVVATTDGLSTGTLVHQPSTAVGATTVAPFSLDASPTVRGPFVVPEGNFVLLDILEAPAALLLAEALPGPVSAEAAALAAPAAPHEPLAAVEVTAPLVTAPATVLNPAMAPGAVSIGPPAIEAPAAVLDPDASVGVVTIEALHLAAPASAHDMADILLGGVTVETGVLSVASDIPDPVVAVGAVGVAALALAAPSEVHDVGVLREGRLYVDHIDAPPSLYTPDASLIAEAPLLAAPAAAHEVAVQATNDVGAESVVAPVFFPNPRLNPGEVFIGTPLVSGPATLHAPLAEVAAGVPLLVAHATVLEPESTTSTADALLLATGVQIHAPAGLPGEALVEASLLAQDATLHTPAAEAVVTVETDGLVVVSEIHFPGVEWGAVDVLIPMVVDGAVVYAPATLRVYTHSRVRETASTGAAMRRTGRTMQATTGQMRSTGGTGARQMHPTQAPGERT
jgi:hypothetical protein